MIGVYILESLKNGKHYIGSSENINRRLYEHNHGSGGVFTSINKPWKLVWKKEFANVKDARIEEKRIKSFKGGNAFKKLLK